MLWPVWCPASPPSTSPPCPPKLTGCSNESGWQEELGMLSSASRAYLGHRMAVVVDSHPFCDTRLALCCGRRGGGMAPPEWEWAAMSNSERTIRKPPVACTSKPLVYIQSLSLMLSSSLLSFRLCVSFCLWLSLHLELRKEKEVLFMGAKAGEAPLQLFLQCVLYGNCQWWLKSRIWGFWCSPLKHQAIPLPNLGP